MTDADQRRPRRAANARTPGAVLADLAEIERMVEVLRSRYVHAHDLAYSGGGGGGFEATGRSAIADSNPTEAAAINAGKEGSRHQVARAGREVSNALKAVNSAHSALVNAMPGADPYEPVWKAGKDDPIASRLENAEQLERARARARRGEL